MKRAAIVILFAVTLFNSIGSQHWRRGWRHYKEGGGVFVRAPLNESEMESALSDFGKARKSNPLKGKYWNYEGHALRYLGRHEEALRTYEKGRKALGGEFTARYHIAYCLMRLERYPEMVDALRFALKKQKRLSSRVRFWEHFDHLVEEEFMFEFRNQFKSEQIARITQ